MRHAMLRSVITVASVILVLGALAPSAYAQVLNYETAMP